MAGELHLQWEEAGKSGGKKSNNNPVQHRVLYKLTDTRAGSHLPEAACSTAECEIGVCEPHTQRTPSPLLSKFFAPPARVRTLLSVHQVIAMKLDVQILRYLEKVPPLFLLPSRRALLARSLESRWLSNARWCRPAAVLPGKAVGVEAHLSGLSFFA